MNNLFQIFNLHIYAQSLEWLFQIHCHSFRYWHSVLVPFPFCWQYVWIGDLFIDSKSDFVCDLIFRFEIYGILFEFTAIRLSTLNYNEINVNQFLSYGCPDIFLHVILFCILLANQSCPPFRVQLLQSEDFDIHDSSIKSGSN